MKMYLCLFMLLCTASFVSAELNRCGAIADNRTVYTGWFDASNGHDLLHITMTTNTSSGWTWQDVLNDQNKWDDINPWVYCTIQMESGVVFPCEAERRGDWAAETPMPSLKVKMLRKGDDYKGMDKLLINKHPWDTTRVRNKLSYELLQQVPEMASQFTQFAVLTVDGTYYGLFTLVEDIDDHMLDTHGLGKKANLYKSNEVSWDIKIDKDVKLATDPTFNETNFETFWDIRGNDDNTLLLRAYQQIFDANLGNREVMEGIFNVDNFATWLAFMFLSGQRDMTFNNYGLYAPLPSMTCSYPTPFYMIAWDNDGAWDEVFFTTTRGKNFPYYAVGVQYFWYIRPVKRFLMVPEYVDLLKTKMDYLITNVMTSQKIQDLTDAYKTIIQPLLELEPDKSNICCGADLAEWTKNINMMHTFPGLQYADFPETINNPMPINQYHKILADGTAVFFYWDQSYIIGDKPFYYDFYLSTDKTVSNATVNLYSTSTTNNHAAVPTSLLAPSTVYYYRVMVRSVADPARYFSDSFNQLSENGGYGTSKFTTPAALSPLPAATAATITHGVPHTGTDGHEYHYATLDDLDPVTASAACSTDAFIVPDGWVIAPNNQEVRQHIKELNLPWGGSYLVLADGASIDGTGRLLDGFYEASQHLFARPSPQNSSVLAYYSDCTLNKLNARILLADPATLSYHSSEEPEPPTIPPNPTISSTGKNHASTTGKSNASTTGKNSENSSDSPPLDSSFGPSSEEVNDDSPKPTKAPHSTAGASRAMTSLFVTFAALAALLQ